MALTDHIYDQRLYLRRPPVSTKILHHFRMQLSDGSTHDVLAATAEDAELFVTRRNPRKTIVRTERPGGA